MCLVFITKWVKKKKRTSGSIQEFECEEMNQQGNQLGEGREGSQLEKILSIGTNNVDFSNCVVH